VFGPVICEIVCKCGKFFKWCVILVVMRSLRSEFFTFLKCKEFLYLSVELLISILKCDKRRVISLECVLHYTVSINYFTCILG